MKRRNTKMVADPELDNQIRALLAAEQKIGAIELVRTATRWDLRRSKDYVDYIERTPST